MTMYIYNITFFSNQFKIRSKMLDYLSMTLEREEESGMGSHHSLVFPAYYEVIKNEIWNILWKRHERILFK